MHLRCWNDRSEVKFSKADKEAVQSSAINNEVFPDPVSPMTRFTQFRLKRTSPSILSMNLRLVGVSDPSSADQAKVALRNPIAWESGTMSAGTKYS